MTMTKSTTDPKILTQLSHDLFRAKKDIEITNRITFHIPTVDEIYELGFEKYMGTVSLMTSVGMDIPLILDELGEDFTTIDDFYLFSKYIAPSLETKYTSIIFPNVDFNDTFPYPYTDDEGKESIALISTSGELLMTQEIYEYTMYCLRYTHLKKRNNIILVGQSAKDAYLEDAYLETLIKEDQNNDDSPSFEDLISTMILDPGFPYNQDTVFDMKFTHFLISVQRSKQIHNADLLLSSGYSGFGVDLKKINQKELNRFAKLDFG